MIYRAIGIMSGSSLDGLDIALVEFHENGGKWQFEIQQADCLAYTPEWRSKLEQAVTLNALDYQLLHTAYGHYIGAQVNAFIDRYDLHYKIAVIGSHGHTTFHVPEQRMTGQIGDGAAIAAETGLTVVTDLRAMDVALGGQGAPIVPIGEQLLLPGYRYFLNIGGIANLSVKDRVYRAFDVCAANRVLNLLAGELGREFDANGALAATGEVNEALLEELDALDFYQLPAPKSLANDFGTDRVYPILQRYGGRVEDRLRTYTEHIVRQVARALETDSGYGAEQQLLVTGGGALNGFLMSRLKQVLKTAVVVPDEKLVLYKEAMIMALMAVLRWREETNVLCSVTGASRDSAGGAMWLGTQA
ncbi:anhydro-N-acetylmuramic acid kinase [Niabella drilacis]|uniref:Anhydro-N-acetylmuramic acid kinase n=1 Tax=Niabella drilacis (strain DSM 25811 / CCM 8410 / CCUG 62505 / LMG 26954 / E90) TaxID=1285928 RepID=A0A1G7AT17_NIADE|nr:anhydro-N-acetylmuramic acid kinase [Niabella drilacis]SDE17999.1 anhydro-N-acetylmuramic acid kinase [Niabella drilacis]